MTHNEDVQRVIDVVGAVILRDGEVLCVQRGPGGSLPGLWEFPGGKIEVSEDAPSALVREIDEELGCLVEVGDEVTTTAHEYEFGLVRLTTFYCRLTFGTPSLTEHSEMRWLRPAELSSLEWAPADIPAVGLVQQQLA